MQKPLYNNFTKMLNKRAWLLTLLSWVICLSADGQHFQNLLTASEQPLLVKSLKLQRKKLDSVPAQIAQFKNIETLDLSKNKIQKLPAFLNQLPHLHTLILSKNQMDAFPEFLQEAPALRVLVLDRNPIPQIPASIANFKHLENLDLWDSSVNHIDSAIVQCPQLIQLDLRNTYFKTTQLTWISEAMPRLKLFSTYGCDCDD